MIDFDQFRDFVCSGNWSAVHAMLDDARDRAVTDDDIKDEAYWRVVALTRETRYNEALDFLTKNSDRFDCRSWLYHESARILIKLGRDREALDELRKAPIEEEMEDYYGLAIDAKFFYLYLLAKSGDPSVKDRLSEIPDDYRHITMGGTFLTKADIASFLK